MPARCNLNKGAFSSEHAGMGGAHKATPRVDLITMEGSKSPHPFVGYFNGIPTETLSGDVNRGCAGAEIMTTVS